MKFISTTIFEGIGNEVRPVCISLRAGLRRRFFIATASPANSTDNSPGDPFGALPDIPKAASKAIEIGLVFHVRNYWTIGEAETKPRYIGWQSWQSHRGPGTVPMNRVDRADARNRS
jgi:hypothetical protein